MHEENTTVDSSPTTNKKKSKWTFWAGILATIGTLGWLAVFLLLDACQQGEQLAKFFAALANVIVMAVVGGPATLVLIVALVIARRAKAASWVNVLSIVGLIVGGLLTCAYLPQALLILH